jgi:hypothetical protein
VKRFLLVLLLCLSAASGFAQQPIIQGPAIAQAVTLQSAAVANGNGTLMTVTGESVAMITVNCATCSGGTQINFELSEDNTNYASVNGILLGTNTIASTTTTAGITIWEIPVTGAQSLRARISAYSAGTVTVTGHAVPVSYGSKVVNANVVSGSTGNAAAGNTGSAIPTQGDYLGVNVAGTLRGATAVNPSGTVYATQTDLTSVNGVTTLTGTGATGTGAQRVTVSGDTATVAGSAPGTAGTASANVLSVQGIASMTKLLVTPDSVALPANQSVNEAQVNGVTVLTGVGAAGTGTQRVVDVASGTTGAAPPAQASFVGGLQSGATGGFLGGFPACDLGKVVNISTATTTLMVTGVSGRQVRICAFHMITTLANNVAWLEGTGATCGTGTAGMAGGTTAASGYNFAANGGIAMGTGIGQVMLTATTGDSVCLITSAATQLSGFISYTIY